MALFIGGDILPSGHIPKSVPAVRHSDFIRNFLEIELTKLRDKMGPSYPQVFLIMGNDDSRFQEVSLLAVAAKGLLHYLHNRSLDLNQYRVYGYSCVPPTPFLLKDWERYDISRYTNHGSISPEEGYYSVPVPDHSKRYSTIQNDLENLVDKDEMTNAIFLFHAPPYNTNLDRAELDEKSIDSVPMDVHIGSIAVKRFIEARQPLISLHGHVHESARLTGCWREKIGRTHVFSAAHDGKELALVRFDPQCPAKATRVLL